MNNRSGGDECQANDVAKANVECREGEMLTVLEAELVIVSS